MAKNIAVYLDGTWDTYQEGVSNNSNVGRMYEGYGQRRPRGRWFITRAASARTGTTRSRAARSASA